LYLRFSSLIDLSTQIIKIDSRQALAERLGIGISTLNAYRSGTRFPEAGPASLLRKRIQELLYDAILLTKDTSLKNFDCEAYVLSCLQIENYFRRLNKDFYLGDIGVISSKILYLLFSEVKTSFTDPKSILISLLSQQPSIVNLSCICRWIFDSYIEYVHDYNYLKTVPRTPLSISVTSTSNFIKTYLENNNISIPTSQAWDVVLLCSSKVSLELSFSEAPQNEGRVALSKFNLSFNENIYQNKEKHIITWHRPNSKL